MGKKQPEIDYSGEKITLPVVHGKPMELKTAIEFLEQYNNMQMEAVSPYHEILCHPLDGLVAVSRALAEKYGWVGQKPTPGFFGDTPPALIGVPVSPTESIQVPLGNMQLPGLDGVLTVQMKVYPVPKITIGGTIRKRDEQHIVEIVELVREKLRTQSIYKGKALKIDFEWMELVQSKVRSYDITSDAPQFMPLDASVERNLIFSDDVQNALSVGLFTPIENTDACRKCKIPLKRGILMYGKYGTGKTLTANITALKATRNGWTFLYLKSVTHLKYALDFAKSYAPCVLFAEDIDRVVTGERSEGMDQILNTLDGIDTKEAEIITVFSTNHIERINPALLRMGRLDSIIEITPPDATAAIELVRLYGRNLLAADTDLSAVGAMLAGKIPAFIRETIERAKLALIARTKVGELIGQVTAGDILSAARTMEAHDRLIFDTRPKVIENRVMLLNVPMESPNGQLMMNLAGNLSQNASLDEIDAEELEN